MQIDYTLTLILPATQAYTLESNFIPEFTTSKPVLDLTDINNSSYISII